MNITEKLTNTHELVLIGRDDAVGYHGIIAIHNTALGPAVGGTRFWNYDSEEEALTDALRLSRGMTYKSALAGLPLGGGKSIIIGNHSAHNRTALLRFDRESVFGERAIDLDMELPVGVLSRNEHASAEKTARSTQGPWARSRTLV